MNLPLFDPWKAKFDPVISPSFFETLHPKGHPACADHPTAGLTGGHPLLEKPVVGHKAAGFVPI